MVLLAETVKPVQDLVLARIAARFEGVAVQSVLLSARLNARRLSWEKVRVVTALYHIEAFVFLLIHAPS